MGRPSVPPPPPPIADAATRALRRAQLRRMPTELVLTTRMMPVRIGAEHGSAIRPVAEVVATDAPAPFDRRPTGPCLPGMEQLNAEALRRAAPKFRPVAAVVTQHADYSVPDAPAAMADELDNLPELSSDSFSEVNAAVLENEAYVAAVSGRSNRPITAPAYVVDRMPPHVQAQTPLRSQTLPRPQTPPRPQPAAASTRPRAQAAARKRDDTPSSRHSQPQPFDALAQAHRKLAEAVENARKSEQRARDAEMMAAWAERYVPRTQDSKQHFVLAQRDQRMRWIKRALQVSLLGLAIGGYISLLGPVRERVISQNATIQKLTELQEQLRSEQRELRERLEQERVAQTEVTPPPTPPREQRATRGKALAPR